MCVRLQQMFQSFGGKPVAETRKKGRAPQAVMARGALQMKHPSESVPETVLGFIIKVVQILRKYLLRPPQLSRFGWLLRSSGS